MRLKDKPVLFSAAIILSITGSILAILGYSLVVLFYEKSIHVIENLSNSTSLDQASRLYFILFVCLYFVSIIGVIKMGKWQKSGFFIYLIAQLVILFLPAVWIGGNAFSSTNAIFTALFFFIYSMFYSQMKRSEKYYK